MSIEILHLLKRKRNFKGFFGANLKSRYGIAIININSNSTFIKPRNNNTLARSSCHCIVYQFRKKNDKRDNVTGNGVLKLVKQQKKQQCPYSNSIVTKVNLVFTFNFTNGFNSYYILDCVYVTFGTKTQDMGSIGTIFLIFFRASRKCYNVCVVTFIYLSVGKYKLLVLYLDLPYVLGHRYLHNYLPTFYVYSI